MLRRGRRGVKLELINPPEDAFVDGRIIRALQANLFAVLRDILFVNGRIHNASRLTSDLEKLNTYHQSGVLAHAQRQARCTSAEERQT